MLVTNKQTYRVTRSANINASKGKIHPGGQLETLTFPDKSGADGDTILVRYSGQNGTGEARTGTKFKIKVTSLVKVAERIK